MGTFGVKRRADSAWTEDWCIADEIGYMQETCGQIPFGGEVLSGQNPAAKEMLRALCDLRVSYLNSIHEEQVLNRWKQMEYGEWGVSTSISVHIWGIVLWQGVQYFIRTGLRWR